MARFDDVTRTQQAMWSRGDFHRIGVSQLVVGELLVRDLQVHAGERVLDVAGGSGNTALASARRWARVTCSDYVPALLSRANERARAEGLPLQTCVADAQALPFRDGSFDVVTSTFGAMFAPDQAATAAELMRVLRPGGRLGMASWTPDSWVGAHFALQARYAPPAADVSPPTVWGTDDGLARLFAGSAGELATTRQYVEIMHPTTDGLFGLFRDWFGPVATLLSRLDAAQRAAFTQDWMSITEEFNTATDGTCDVPSTYLQVVAVKRA